MQAINGLLYLERFPLNHSQDTVASRDLFASELSPTNFTVMDVDQLHECDSQSYLKDKLSFEFIPSLVSFFFLSIT